MSSAGERLWSDRDEAAHLSMEERLPDLMTEERILRFAADILPSWEAAGPYDEY